MSGDAGAHEGCMHGEAGWRLEARSLIGREERLVVVER